MLRLTNAPEQPSPHARPPAPRGHSGERQGGLSPRARHFTRHPWRRTRAPPARRQGPQGGGWLGERGTLAGIQPPPKRILHTSTCRADGAPPWPRTWIPTSQALHTDRGQVSASPLCESCKGVPRSSCSNQGGPRAGSSKGNIQRAGNPKEGVPRVLHAGSRGHWPLCRACRLVLLADAIPRDK